MPILSEKKRDREKEMPVPVLGLHHLVVSRLAPAFAVTLAPAQQKKGGRGDFLTHCSAQTGCNPCRGDAVTVF